MGARGDAGRIAPSVLAAALLAQGMGHAAEQPVWLSCRLGGDGVACTENQPIGQFQDQWLVPYHRPQPQYPRRLMNQGQEGCALIGFTVTEQGRTANIQTLQSEVAERLAATAVEAVEQYRFHSLKAEVQGVAVRLCFSLS